MKTRWQPKGFLNTISIMKAFFLFAFSFSVWSARAQTELSLAPPSFSDTFLLDLSVEYSDETAAGILKNESEETVLLRWEVHSEGIGCPESWQFLFCDENFCGAASTTSNVNPGSDPNLPLEIEAGKLSTFDLTLRPRGSAGCCDPTVTVSTVDDFEEILLTAEYHICVEGLTATSEAEVTEIQLFPNPTAGHFFLTENEKVHSVLVTDFHGRQVRRFAEGENYDLAGLPAGLYVVHLMGQDGVVFQSLKIVTV